MLPKNVALAQNLAAAERRLETLTVLCWILSRRVKGFQQDLRQVRSAIAATQGSEENGQPEEVPHALPD